MIHGTVYIAACHRNHGQDLSCHELAGTPRGWAFSSLVSSVFDAARWPPDPWEVTLSEQTTQQGCNTAIGRWTAVVCLKPFSLCDASIK